MSEDDKAVVPEVAVEPTHDTTPSPVVLLPCTCSLESRQLGDELRKELAVQAELKRCGAA